MFIEPEDIIKYSDNQIVRLESLDGYKYYLFDSPKERQDYINFSNKFTELFLKMQGDINFLEHYNSKIDIDMPDSARMRVQEAVNYKREGSYYEALLIYDELYNEFKLTEAIVNGLYKLLVSAGFASFAMQMLIATLPLIKEADDTGYYYQNDLAHFRDLRQLYEDKEKYIQYVTVLSGNPNYELPYDYEFIKNGLQLVIYHLEKQYL